jgi:hypothetical protein
MFEIVQIPAEREFENIEQLGSRKKFWYYGDDGILYLFKEGRPNTGENWSEKVAAELCELLGVPHAAYELAVCKYMKGVVSPNFVPEEGRLVHGNELLRKFSQDYEVSRKFRQRQHTLSSVLAIIRSKPAEPVEPPINWSGLTGIESAVEVFLGYLMLDAWIANQDRHHENWGFIIIPGKRRPKVHLAPSFDHASGLGRNETDKNRQEILTTKDKGRAMESYVERARSAFYFSPSDPKPMPTIEAFRKAAQRWPRAAESWLERLEAVTPLETKNIFDRIPEGEITAVSIEFAQTILSLNRGRLLVLKRDFS